MSIKAMTWYWDHSEQEGHKLLLLLALADWANDEGECYPSVAGLSKRARRDRRNIQRAIANLEKDGEILVYEGMGKGAEGRRSPLYYLLKYRKSLSLDLPPMIVEAARYYREQSRKQGKKGAEIRKSQASLLGKTEGVTPVSPPTGGADAAPTGGADAAPTGGADAAPTGGADAAPTGGADAAQIRQYDPSLDPSNAREGDHSVIGNSPLRPITPSPPAPSADTLIAKAAEVADTETFDGPAVDGVAKMTTPRRRQPMPDSPFYTGREFKGGRIPAEQGRNAVQVYYERHSIRDNKTQLSAPLETDINAAVSDLGLWRQVVIAWHQAGYNPINIKGMLDWYRNGIPERTNGNQPSGGSFGLTAYAEKERKQNERDFGPDKPISEEKLARIREWQRQQQGGN